MQPPRKQYQYLICFYHIRLGCEAEKSRAALARPRHLMCSVCKESHESKFFSLIQTLRKREESMCIGTFGVLEICNPQRATFAGLKTRGVNVKDQFAHGWSLSHLLTRASEPTQMNKVKGDAQLVRGYYLLSREIGKTISAFVVLEVVYETKNSLCLRLTLNLVF